MFDGRRKFEICVVSSRKRSGMEINMSKIAVFFGTGYEEIEALTVVDILRRAGETVEMVSITDETKVTGFSSRF